jgi:hypothetical protein
MAVDLQWGFLNALLPAQYDTQDRLILQVLINHSFS